MTTLPQDETLDQKFERAKAMFGHNSEQARALNEQMTRVPALSITLTGGLWFGAGITETLDTIIRFALLIFAGFANGTLVLACIRIRDVLESYLEKIEAFWPSGFASGRPSSPRVRQLQSYSMIVLYSLLMGTAGALSFIGAFVFYWPEEVIPAPRWFGVLILLAFVAGYALLLFRKDLQRWISGPPSPSSPT